MKPDPDQVKQIFELCVSLDEAELEDVLNQSCGSDSGLRNKVEDLLKAHNKNESDLGFLEWGHGTREGSIDPGTQIGSFTIIGFVSKGSFGEVYAATNDSGEKVAIKLLLPWKSDHLSKSRFEREAKSLSKVNHPNVARLIQTGEYKGRSYLATEFIEGMPLDEAVISTQNSLPSLRQRVAWVIDVCKGVAAIHEHLLLHRDIKPSNILVRNDGTAVVTDLGISKSIANEFDGSKVTLTGEFVGTPKYMAPEQLSRNSQLVLGTDVYGIGGLMYFLLTGKPPFNGDSLFEIAESIRTRSPVRPSLLNAQIEKDLETICLKCLNKESAHRYQTVNGLEADLVRWMERKPIKARQIGFATSAAYWCRRNPVVATLTLTLLTMTLTGLITVSMLWRQAELKNQQLLLTLRQLTDVEQEALKGNRDMAMRRDVLVTLVNGYQNVTKRDAELEKQHAVACLKLGRVEWGLGNRTESKVAISEALARFELLAESDPENLEYRFDIFHSLNDMKRFPEALECITTLSKLSPDNEDFQDCLSHANMKLGESLRINGEPESALNYFDHAEQISKTLIENCSKEKLALFRKKLGIIWNLRARAHLQLGQWAATRKDLNRAIELLDASRSELGKVEDVLRQQLTALQLKSALHAIDQDYTAAIKSIKRAEERSREYLSIHKSLPMSYGFRYRILRDYAFLAAELGDRELHGEIQVLIESHFKTWKNANLGHNSLAKLEADFLTDVRINLRPDFDRAEILLPPEPPNLSQFAMIRIALRKRDLKIARSTMKSWTNGFDQPYFDYYRQVIDSLEQDKPIDTSQLFRPNKQMQIEALARGYSIRNALSFRSIEAELRFLGLIELR